MIPYKQVHVSWLGMSGKSQWNVIIEYYPYTSVLKFGLSKIFKGLNGQGCIDLIINTVNTLMWNIITM